DVAPIVIPDAVPSCTDVERKPFAQYQLLLRAQAGVGGSPTFVLAQRSPARSFSSQGIEKNASILQCAFCPRDGRCRNSWRQRVNIAINQISTKVIPIEIAECSSLRTLEILRIHEQHSADGAGAREIVIEGNSDSSESITPSFISRSIRRVG